MTDDVHPTGDILILIPTLNDWSALSRLLPLLDGALATDGRRGRVLVVDDGSSQPVPAGWPFASAQALARVEVLHLRRNLGHQRAIAIGLAYAEANLACDAVVVMDGDGEDGPDDVVRLLECYEANGGDKIVFAERAKRSENAVFRLFYHLFRLVHRLLTGRQVKVGNFSVVPAKLLRRLVVVSDLWNHYSAAVFSSRMPHTMLRTDRAKRLEGESTMGFASLAVHGLSAISVFGDRVGVRLVGGILTLSALLGGLVILAIGWKLLTGTALPAWALYGAAIAAVLLLQMLLASVIFVFLLLDRRNSLSFLPVRDHAYFVDSCRTHYPRD